LPLILTVFPDVTLSIGAGGGAADALDPDAISRQDAAEGDLRDGASEDDLRSQPQDLTESSAASFDSSAGQSMPGVGALKVAISTASATASTAGNTTVSKVGEGLGKAGAGLMSGLQATAMAGGGVKTGMEKVGGGLMSGFKSGLSMGGLVRKKPAENLPD